MLQKQTCRFICFTNYFLSGLQKGLQTAHAVTELMVNHYLGAPEDAHQLVINWAIASPTIIIKNGGNHKQLVQLVTFLRKGKLPYSSFREGKDFLNNSMTAVGVLVPDNYFENEESLTEWDKKLRKTIKDAPLATG